jgi:hypothetical protein
MGEDQKASDRERVERCRLRLPMPSESKVRPMHQSRASLDPKEKIEPRSVKLQLNPSHQSKPWSLTCINPTRKKRGGASIQRSASFSPFPSKFLTFAHPFHSSLRRYPDYAPSQQALHYSLSQRVLPLVAATTTPRSASSSRLCDSTRRRKRCRPRRRSSRRRCCWDDLATA